MPNESLTQNVQEIDLLEGSDRQLILRLHTPVGTETFPIVLDLHGGAWCKGHIDDCGERDDALAAAGIAAGALDLGMEPRVTRHPTKTSITPCAGSRRTLESSISIPIVSV